MANGKYNDEKYIGKRYNRLTVIGFERGKTGNGSTQWLWKVKCDCGVEKIMVPFYVVNGRNVSCGCYRKYDMPNPYKTHGESNTKLFKAWDSMLNRCNPRSTGSQHYGKRGIKVCGEWEKYENFAKWARENGYEEGLTIERIDVNGNYCPENCKWITKHEQQWNKRTTRYVTYRGEKMSLSKACEIAGMPYKVVHSRMAKNKWSFEDAISIPLNATRSYKRSEKPGRRSEIQI